MTSDQIAILYAAALQAVATVAAAHIRIGTETGDIMHELPNLADACVGRVLELVAARCDGENYRGVE